MARQIDDLSGHVVVAGSGRVGTAIAAYARKQGAEVVVVDQEDADGVRHGRCTRFSGVRGR